LLRSRGGIDLKRLEGKVAVITGGARGMGASHVRRFVKEGARVVFTDILDIDGETLASELGGNAKFIKHDVTSASDWEYVIQKTEESFGSIDILVNNAGISVPEENLEDVEETIFRKVIDVNQISVFLGMKAVVPSMKKAGGGSIVNISSLAGIVGGYKLLAYTSSKFAVRGLTKAAALELGDYGIRVNSVHPGFIKTPMTDGLISDEIQNRIPLRKAGEPEEVTNVVLFLASDESSYSTGAEYIIDGGIGAQ
jgi:3alpha(or 20beta)-hydroxysteroid dehydrogenase